MYLCSGHIRNMPIYYVFYVRRVRHVHLRTLLADRPTRPLHHGEHNITNTSLAFPRRPQSSCVLRVGKMAAENGIVTPKRKDGSNISPTSLKKRRVLEERSQVVNTPPPTRTLKSSQPVKSSFEEDLDRLTQEIGEVGDSTYLPPILTRPLFS